MKTMTRPVPQSFEVYMQLTDRKRLARLMAIQEVSARSLATAAGWKSHSYMNRLLNGTVSTCQPEHAVKIAAFLGVAVDDLFVPRVTNGGGQIVKQQSRRSAA